MNKLEKINGNWMEYVSSGVSFTRLTAGPEVHEGELRVQLTTMIQKMQNCGKMHRYSALANALTEVEICKLLNLYKDSFYSAYNDSGALQIAQGSQKGGSKVAPEKLKTGVYEVQSKYADYAFIFDEPPIGFAGDSVSKHSPGQKWFEHNRVEEAGILTGKNITAQLKLFQNNNSKAKVMIIAHGNCLSSYQDGLNYMMDQVPDNLKHQIGGLAIGGGCLGNGPLEDAKKAFFFSQLDHGLDTSHIHILGVGSVTRFFPFFIMIQNGMFKNLRISYDSTTHTSGSTFGRYSFDGFGVDVNRIESQWKKVYEDVCSKFDFSDISFEDFYEAGLCSSFVKYEEAHGSKDILIRTQLSLALASTWNFIDKSEEFLYNKNMLESYIMSNNKFRPLQFLYQVKTADDFNEWDKQFGKHLRSNEVKSQKVMSLDDFFN